MDDSYKQWLEDQIRIWNYNAKIEEQEGDHKAFGISTAWAKAYHTALCEYTKYGVKQ